MSHNSFSPSPNSALCICLKKSASLRIFVSCPFSCFPTGKGTDTLTWTYLHCQVQRPNLVLLAPLKKMALSTFSAKYHSFLSVHSWFSLSFNKELPLATLCASLNPPHKEMANAAPVASPLWARGCSSETDWHKTPPNNPHVLVVFNV